MRASDRRSGREFLLALSLLILTLLSGFLIQGALNARELRRQDLLAAKAAAPVIEGLRQRAETVRASQADTAAGLKDLPAEKRQRLEDLDLSLLMIVSAASPMPEGWSPKLKTVIEEYEMDERCADTLMQMVLDCQEAGGQSMICSAYRTREYQEMLYENKVQRVLASGWMTIEEARSIAAEEVAVPGYSEHESGLAADIIDESYPFLDEWQENTFTQQWLKEHAVDYGFILRYPPGTEELTGIIYEPWHYRYVGLRFAHEIKNRNLTLEEYVAWRRGR